MVENMSHYVCPRCGQSDPIFGQGGVERAARALGVPYLGGIPLNTSIRISGDAGRPRECFESAELPVRSAIESFVQRLHEQVAARARQRQPLPQLKIQ
jgi:ATP-binding protein involved in chromosome partitioning